jgi:phosphoglycolate phosphatase
MHPLLLLWDIDGTLISTGGGGREAIRSALLNRFGILDDLGDIRMAGRTDISICAEIAQKHQTHSIPSNELLDAYVEELPFFLEKYEGRVHKGVRQILEWSHAHNEVHNALLTGNIKRGAFMKLKKFKLDHFFEFGAFADDSGDRNKLGPIALDRARTLLKKDFHIEYTWILGDTPKDIACARALGCKVLAVATGDYTTTELKSFEPDLVFENLENYKEVIQKIEKS